MHFQRRQLLRTLSFAFGSSFIWNRNQLGIAAQTAIQPKVSPPPAGAAVRDGIAGGTEMEKVTGIGGFFFEPKIRKRWGFGTSNTWESRSYPRATGNPLGSKRPDPPLSLHSKRRATISGIPRKSGLLNFRVRDLDKMAAQLQAAGMRSRWTRSLIPTAGLPACMTLREIRSNCGSLRFQTPKARL